MFKAMSFNEFHDWFMENVPELFWPLNETLRYCGPYTFDNAIAQIKSEYEAKESA